MASGTGSPGFSDVSIPPNHTGQRRHPRCWVSRRPKAFVASAVYNRYRGRVIDIDGNTVEPRTETGCALGRVVVQVRGANDQRRDGDILAVVFGLPIPHIFHSEDAIADRSRPQHSNPNWAPR